MIACANISFGQIADDFEFIDHRVHQSTHGVSKVMGDELIYVAHNAWPGPMTSVIKVNTHNNSVDTILTTFSSISSLQEFPDGSFNIFLHSLFDYDVIVPGFYAIEYDGSGFDVNIHTPYVDPLATWDEYPYTSHVVKGDDDIYYLNSWTNIYRFNADLTSDTLHNSNNNFKFHQNSERDIYTYDLHTLYSFSEDSLTILNEFDQQILDIENSEEFNDVLLNGLLERWTIDFSQKIVSWPISEEITSFNQLDVDFMTLTGLIRDENQFTIYEYDVFGNEDFIFQDEYENQSVIGFHPVTESKILLVGTDSIPEVGFHSNFFRNIDFNNEIEYQSRDVSIDSLILYQFDKEEEFQYVNSSTGDSIFLTYYYTDLKMSLSNQSDTIISLLDCKSGLFSEWFFSYILDYSYKDLQLMPGESLFIADTLRQIEAVQDLHFAVPGADFRFNNHPNKIAFPDFSADFEDVALDIGVNLFPNPTTETLHVEIDAQLESIEVYNSIGELMIFKSSGSNLSLIDVSRLKPGSYFVRFLALY